MDLAAASSRLAGLELHLQVDTLSIDVLWFRVMHQLGRWQINRHTHSSFEFHFVSSGVCRVSLDSGEFEARAGEFYLTSPGVYHEQSGSGEYTEYSVNYDISERTGEGAEGAALLELLARAECRATKDLYGAIRLFDLALAEADEQRIGWYSNIRSLCSMILTVSARSLGEGRKYPVPKKKSDNDHRFSEIEKFVSDNLGTRITDSDLANHMYLSKKQIARIIQKSTGMPPRKYINTIRLRAAKQLLRESSLSIKQIAERLGFTGEYYFNQFFRREEGYPPGTYRKSLKLG